MVDEDRRARRTARGSSGSPRPGAPSPRREGRPPARRAGRRAGLPTTARATSTSRRSRAPSPPTFACGESVEPDEARSRARTSVAARRALRARVLVDHRDVVEDRELLDRLLGLERPPQAPARAPEVRHRAAGPRRTRGSCPRPGLTNPQRTLKNVVLPAPFGPIRPQVPPGKATLIVVDRRHAGEADGEILDLDHGACLVRVGLLAHRARRRAARASPCPSGTAAASPPGAVSEHLEEARAEDDEHEVRVDAPLRLEEERAAAAEDARDDRAPEAVDPADQRRREQRQRVLRLEG